MTFLTIFERRVKKMTKLTHRIPKFNKAGRNSYGTTEFEPFSADFAFPRIQSAAAPRKQKSSLTSGKFGSTKKPSGKAGIRSGRSGK